MTDAVIIALGGMAVVFASLAALWLVMSLLGWAPRQTQVETPVAIETKVDVEPVAPSAQDEDVVAIAAALLQAEARPAPRSLERRPMSLWRAAVR